MTAAAPIAVVETAVFQRTGGLRKLRWRLAGRGKRGGTRVIYDFHDVEMPLYLLLAYSKSSKADVSAGEWRRLMGMAQEASAGRKGKKRS